MADTNLSAFIWSVADLLRGDFKQSEYGKIILPFTVLRRLDCVLAPTKDAVLEEAKRCKKEKLSPEIMLHKAAKHHFYNASPLDLKKLMGDQDNLGANLRSYVHGFSPAVRDIFEQFDFDTQIDRLTKANLLYLVSEKFTTIDLHPKNVSNAQMGSIFEELIRKFAELSNETAGEHFTPREVIRLMVNLLFIEDDDALTQPGVVRSVADDHLSEINPKARLVMHGQKLNPENVALSEKVDICFQREVKPHVPAAWIDDEKTKVGYEIPFNRHFYVFKPPRALAEIDAELKGVTERIMGMLGGLTQ